MRLVAGLGNPGRKYEGTRHNVGFEVVRRVAQRLAAGPVKVRFQGEMVEVSIEGESVVLLCPSTYMNRSGQSVRSAVDFFKLAPDQVLVVCDDLSLPSGKLRFRARGSSGGQKGLLDVIRHLGTEEVPRLRIGIDRPPERIDPADYVLQRFSKAEQELIAEAIDLAVQGVVDWATRGLEHCMNQYNADTGKAKGE